MNAASQAITIELTQKIAHLAVLVRAEFPDTQVDLNPWLRDSKTQQQLDRYSIDLSFHLPRHADALACTCILMEVKFSEGLLCPGCRLSGINAWGFDRQQQQWQFSSAEQVFSGFSIPQYLAQARFIRLTERIARIFKSFNSKMSHEA
ncbi:MAG: hypothetical protein AAF728_01520 [Cyanobacteria bacterium P01_D01_bin.128]